jgi:hypothetical protein
MNTTDLVSSQASYLRDLLTHVAADGTFSDSDYDHITNACIAMDAIMAYAYEDVPMPADVIDSGASDTIWTAYVKGDLHSHAFTNVDATQSPDE